MAIRPASRSAPTTLFSSKLDISGVLESLTYLGATIRSAGRAVDISGTGRASDKIGRGRRFGQVLSPLTGHRPPAQGRGMSDTSMAPAEPVVLNPEPLVLIPARLASTRLP